MSFSPPGHVDDLGAGAVEAWSTHVGDLFDTAIGDTGFGGGPPPFYNPLKEELDADAVSVTWPALSGTLRVLTHLSEEERWALADRDRVDPATGTGRQDEYCEWSVTRDDDHRITRVTFTSEVFEWFEHVGSTDRDLLARLFSDLIGADVPADDLFDGNEYNPRNRWNVRTDGPIVHLAQRNNSLEAAIRLAAAAAVVRTSGGDVVTDTQALMRCAALGDEDRFSDPAIATAVNAAAAQRARITLADPPGLYLKGIRTAGMRLPEGHEDLNPAGFWIPDRGAAGRAVRAHFEVPGGAFTISDMTLDGKPIVTGAQLAERVDVFLTALVNRDDFDPVVKECGAA